MRPYIFQRSAITIDLQLNCKESSMLLLKHHKKNITFDYFSPFYKFSMKWLIWFPYQLCKFQFYNNNFCWIIKQQFSIKGYQQAFSHFMHLSSYLFIDYPCSIRPEWIQNTVGWNARFILIFVVIGWFSSKYRSRQYYESKVLQYTEVAWFLTAHRSLKLQFFIQTVT